MSDRIKITRRTRVPGTQKKNQVDKFKVEVYKISENQEKFKERLTGIVRQTFGSYKENNFNNDQNLKLLKLFRLLKNIARKDLGFVQAFQQKREDVMDFVSRQVEQIVQDQKNVSKDELDNITGNLDWDEFKKKSIDDICCIVDNAVNKIIEETNIIGQQKTFKDNTLDRAKKLKELESIFEEQIKEGRTKEEKNNYKKNISGTVGNVPEKAYTSERIISKIDRKTTNTKEKLPRVFKESYKTGTVKKAKEKYSKAFEKLQKMDLSPKSITGNKKQFKKFDSKKFIGIPKKDVKKLLKVFKDRNDIEKKHLQGQFKGINRKIKRKRSQMNFTSLVGGLLRGALGIAGAGLKFAGNFLLHGFGIQTVFSGANLLFKTGVFAIKSVYNIGKFAVSTTFSIVKGAVSAAIGLTSFVIKKLKKPILSSLKVLIWSPQAMFIMGLAVGGIVGKLKLLFDGNKENFKKIKDSVKNAYDGLKNFFQNSPLQKAKDYYEKIKNKITDGLGEFMEMLKYFVFPFLPENIVKFAYGYAAGASIALITKFITGKSVIGALGGWIAHKIGLGNMALLAMPVLAIGTFWTMSKELTQIQSDFNRKSNDERGGMNYMRVMHSRTSVVGKNFQTNQSAEQLANEIDRVKDGEKTNSSVPVQAVKDYSRVIMSRKKYNEDVEFYNKEHEILEKEVLAISDAMVTGEKQDTYQNQPNGEKQKKKAVKSTIKYILGDGTKTDYVLVSSQDRIFNFRIGYVLIRNAMLQRFAKGEITKEKYESEVKNIIKLNDKGFMELNDEYMKNPKFMNLQRSGDTHYWVETNWLTGKKEERGNRGAYHTENGIRYSAPSSVGLRSGQYVDFNEGLTSDNAFGMHSILSYTFFANSDEAKKQMEERGEAIQRQNMTDGFSRDKKSREQQKGYQLSNFEIVRMIYKFIKQNQKSDVSSCSQFFTAMFRDEKMMNTLKDMVERYSKKVTLEDVRYITSKKELFDEFIKAQCSNNKILKELLFDVIYFSRQHQLRLVKVKNLDKNSDNMYYGLYNESEMDVKNGVELFFGQLGNSSNKLVIFYSEIKEIIPEYDKVVGEDKWCIKFTCREHDFSRFLTPGPVSEIKEYKRKLEQITQRNKSTELDNNTRLTFATGGFPLFRVASFAIRWQQGGEKLGWEDFIRNIFFISQCEIDYEMIENSEFYLVSKIINSMMKLIYYFIQFQKDAGKYDSGVMQNGTIADNANGTFSQQQKSAENTISDASKESREIAKKKNKEQARRIEQTIGKLGENMKKLKEIKDYIEGKNEGKNGVSGPGLTGKTLHGTGTTGSGGTAEVAEVDTSGQDSEAKSRKHSDERH